MKQFLILVVGIIGLSVASATSLSAHAYAVAPVIVADVNTDSACQALSQLDSSHSCGSAQGGVNNIVKAVISILSYVIGIAAVIMIILAGLGYITAGGDSNKISSAKNTLIYAIVGLVIAAVAQVLVHFVLSTTTNAANGTTSYVVRTS